MPTINYKTTVHHGNYGDAPYKVLVPVPASASDLSTLARGGPRASQTLHRLTNVGATMLLTGGLACSICNRGRQATRAELAPCYFHDNNDSEAPPGPLIVDFCFCQTCSDSACVSAARGVKGEAERALRDSGVPQGVSGPPQDDAPSASSRILGALYGLKQRYDDAARAKAVAAAEDSFAVPEPPRPAVQKKKKTGGKKGKKKRGGGKENKA